MPALFPAGVYACMNACEGCICTGASVFACLQAFKHAHAGVKQVYGSAMENHLLTQCGAVPSSGERTDAAAGASDNESGSGRVGGGVSERAMYTDPIRSQQDREYAEGEVLVRL